MYFNFKLLFHTSGPDASLHVPASETLHANECGASGLHLSSCMASSSALPNKIVSTHMDPSLAVPSNPPTVTHQHNPSASTTPISPSPNVQKHSRGRFAEEYAVYRRKQDQYYDLLIQQTKVEHQEQMKVYKIQQEAAERQCQVHEAHLDMCTAIKNRISDTCSYIERLATECQTKFIKQ